MDSCQQPRREKWDCGATSESPSESSTTQVACSDITGTSRLSRQRGSTVSGTQMLALSTATVALDRTFTPSFLSPLHVPCQCANFGSNECARMAVLLPNIDPWRALLYRATSFQSLISRRRYAYFNGML
jgi:hypothetical protein